MNSSTGSRGECETILTPDQRLRVFVSSTLEELESERRAVRAAIDGLHMSPVMFELGARPHPPRSLYRAYLEQSHVFVAIYWQRYGWVAPGMDVSGLEDEYLLAAGKPRLVYVKRATEEREPRLVALLNRIRESGETSYKTFSSADELRQLVADDLALLMTERFEAVRAPARAGAMPRYRLPAESTCFIGRQAEIAEIVGLMANRDVREVTLTGPGGIGKTRLALRVAASIESRFADGVVFVPLASVAEAALLPQALASALGLRAIGATPAVEAVEDHLRDAQLLLLLDSFEHLVDAASVVTDVLQAAPGLQLLVTSRQPLHILAEHEFPIPPLAVAPTDASKDALAESDAVRLFAERAAAQRHGFEITASNVETVGSICRRLDGVPLAIELAAARVKILALDALRERLGRSLDFLVGGARDLPDRQRTLRSTIEWSHQLCDAAEQRMLARLAIFAGDFTLKAAEAVCGGDDADILALVESLVDKSLVRIDASGREPRFAMLQTIREYALNRLQEMSELEALALRHARYFRDLAVEGYEGMKAGRRTPWMEELTTGSGDADNVRAALRWFVEHDAGDDVATIAWALWLHTVMYGLLDEGRRVVRAALELPSSAASRARLLAVLGNFAEWQGDFGEAATVLAEAIDIAQRERDDDILAYALLARSFIMAGLDDPAVATALRFEALALARKHDDLWGQALALDLIGWMSVALEERDRPRAIFEEAIAVAHVADNGLFLAMSEANLAERVLFDDEDVYAANLLSSALRRFRALRVIYATAYGLDSAARLVARHEEAETAARLLGASDAMRQRIRVPIEPVAGRRRARLVDELRDRLGRERFEVSLSEGAALRFDAAVGAAIAALAPLADESPSRDLP